MMRVSRLLAASMAALLLISGCSSGSDTGSDPDDGKEAAEPVRGGTGRAIIVAEPPTLDPGSIGNFWVQQASIGNAIFGTLFVNDSKTGEIVPVMAKGFTTDDDGKTYTLTLREGMTFTDGEPFDAEAIKYNWDRLLDPERSPFSPAEGAVIDSLEVVDPLTMQVNMKRPTLTFPAAATFSGLVWIASPKWLESLDGGAKADKPVTAGPFVLDSWKRQDVMKLKRNPDYFDPERPYLDALEFRFNPDGNQRYNTLVSGGADIMTETSWQIVDKANKSGRPTDVPALNGGNCLVMNNTTAPFNDVRARQAINKAVNLDTLNQAVSQGAGDIVDSIFTKDSPYYDGIEPVKSDPEGAQKLFDELADEGKPVKFVFKTFQAPDLKAAAESLQAQLQAFKNVELNIEFIDVAELGTVLINRDYDMSVGCGGFLAPDPELWIQWSSESEGGGNTTGFSDPGMDKLLDQAINSTSLDEQRDLFHQIEDLSRELVPSIYFGRTCAAAITNDNVHGLKQYGLGSLRMEELWIE